MVLTAGEKLAIAELAFYAPALPLAIFIAFRHGFGRQEGWLFLVLLGVCRILGAACGIAAEHESNPTTLIEIAAICGSIGISFLTAAMIGLIKRVNQSMEMDKGIPLRFMNLLNLPLLAGIILGIIGGIDQNSPGDPNEVSTGRTYTKVAIILFAVVIFAFAGIIALTALKLKHIPRGERNLLFAVMASYPLLVVRLIYALIAATNPTSKTFSLFHPDYLVEGLMSTMEEFLIVIILLATGFLTPAIDRSAARAGSAGPSAWKPSTQQEQYQTSTVPQYHTAYAAPATYAVGAQQQRQYENTTAQGAAGAQNSPSYINAA